MGSIRIKSKKWGELQKLHYQVCAHQGNKCGFHSKQLFLMTCWCSFRKKIKKKSFGKSLVSLFILLDKGCNTKHRYMVVSLLAWKQLLWFTEGTDRIVNNHRTLISFTPCRSQLPSCMISGKWIKFLWFRSREFYYVLF